jgi:uncharacterized membrane protein YkvA (DUF1232 family)
MSQKAKNFFKNNWSLILVLIYFIFPDFIPGFLDDAALILVERIVHSYISNKNKEKLQSKKQEDIKNK